MRKTRQPKALFVTGTDTGVGKTFVAACIAQALTERGLKVGVFKPFASGSREDTHRLKRCARSNNTPDEITPYYFKYPLAPYASLQLEKRRLHLGGLKSHFEKIRRTHEMTLVEGIGGARVPLSRRADALSVAERLRLPVLVVARLGLGTINHTLLTLEEIRRRKLKILGFVLNQTSASKPGWAERTNPRVLKELTGLRLLGIIPHQKNFGAKKRPTLAQIAEKHIALDYLL